jgi:hypothetical protein
VLLVFRAETAVVRTTFFDLHRKVLRYRTRFVKFKRIQIPVDVGRDQSLVPTMLRAILSKIHSTVTDEDLGIYHLPAFRTQASC